ncbi:AAA family ATPase [Polyangium jinanense]|uniref:histidine kinase n=1 Tax=Polyangium jinanense TaxID=2829994 RepID=A0A9X4AQ06_9BACT|nr:AAA family ATPase [Polyangium jinanense]MDC3952970.1 AAA family ATPase [Polyangium jinanense]MDC3980588.1 AAA family ATPase [Polyangium jinanense]
MFEIAGYSTDELLFEEGQTALYRAHRQRDGLRVVLKTLRRERPTPDQHARLRHEYEISHDLDIPAAIRAYALDTSTARPVLVLEDVAGVSLEQLLGEPMREDRFLSLAARITGALSELHARQIVHRSIRPGCIFVLGEDGDVKLGDFSRAFVLRHDEGPVAESQGIAGALPYMSPEQARRATRVDGRADLYSLGVIFYEMLTGALPFSAQDTLEWIHCHMAQQPRAPAARVPTIPAIVSDIVLKLLAKDPEDRYQSARGLEADLLRCLSQWQEQQRIEPFSLGEIDVPERLRLARRLYGRDAELAALKAAFERVALHGRPELVLISGFSGVGKSTLVGELRRSVIQRNSFFAAGKFDLVMRERPYAIFSQALGELVQKLLGEPEKQIQAWRRRILDALGPNARLMTELVPRLSLIVGEQATVPELPPTEAQGRFRRVLWKLLAIFGTAGHPLVLFLDDLQWVDTASRELIEHLMIHPDTQHLSLLGAYRDNEVGAAHPLARMIGAITEAGACVQMIHLAPLDIPQVEALLVDALHASRDEVAPLGRLIHEKTAGNPFFVNQFLTSLYHEGLLRFDASARAWRWDTERIHEKGYTDSVADLMAAKLMRLSPDTRDVLMLAACAGHQVDMRTLSVITGVTEESLERLLWEPLEGGLLLQRGNLVSFTHDRVQQAAYALVPAERRGDIHLQIGRHLLREAGSPADDRAFDLANHFNLGAERITDPRERETAAALDHAAGRKAHGATAYGAAADYYAAGISLLSLSPDAWACRYDLMWSLHLGRAECRFLAGSPDEAETLLMPLLGQARSRFDMASVHRMLTELHITRSRFPEATQSCLASLALFGVHISPHPSREEVDAAYAAVWVELGERSIESLLEQPPMVDPDARAALDVMSSLIAAAYQTDENLLYLLACQMTLLNLRGGAAPASARGYSLLGMVLGPRFGRFDEGYRFGRLACQLAERHENMASKPMVINLFADHTEYWTHHVRHSARLTSDGLEAALQLGNLTNACYLIFQMLAIRWEASDPLDEVLADSERRIEYVRKTQFWYIIDGIAGIQLAIRRLYDPMAPGLDPALDAPAVEARLRAPVQSAMRSVYYMLKAESLLFAGDVEGAATAAGVAKADLTPARCHRFFPVYPFVRALSLARLAGRASPVADGAALVEVAEHQRRLAAWAARCPENFAHKATLVAAELARLEGRSEEAMALYEQAILEARRHGFVQYEALGNELAGLHYFAKGYSTIGRAYMQEALDCYRRWGAREKVRQLDARFPALDKRASCDGAGAAPERDVQLDTLTVVKATQAISQEIVLPKLLSTLTRLVIEHAGAQRGTLVLTKNEGMMIAATAEAGQDRVTLVPGEPERALESLPMSILHYVRRTRDRVLLGDASSPSPFAADPYILRCRPRSILCAPIIRKDALVGMAYLENNLTARAFTQDKLTVLDFLLSQAAISLENAKLYADLQQENAERRRAESSVRESQQQLQAIIDNTSAIVFIKDLEGRYILINRPFEELFHRNKADIIGRTDDEALGVEEVETYRANDRAVLAAGKPMQLEETVFKDGSKRTYLSLKFPVYDATGQPYGICAIATDITERKRGEEALREAVRLRDEFLSVASHELRTPLTSLQLATQRLRRLVVKATLSPETVGELAAVTERQAKRLGQLVDVLLDVSRLQTGQFTLHFEPVDLALVVREVLVGLDGDLTRCRCPVQAQLGAPVVGQWDKLRLEQVATNLLMNAMKFGAGKPIEVVVSANDGEATLAVTDHGIGIEPGARDRIFRRFERAVPVEHYGGLGLGLYITHQIVASHRGTITVESEPGKGATFTVRLPRATEAATAALE